jgi:hypothetical protein
MPRGLGARPMQTPPIRQVPLHGVGTHADTIDSNARRVALPAVCLYRTMTPDSPAPFLALTARPWAWRLAVVMLGAFIAVAPSVIITRVISRLPEAALKPWFGEADSLLWWALAILGHLLIIVVVIAVMFAKAWPSRVLMAVLMPLLALLLDVAAAAFWWIMAFMSHPHGF